MNKNSGISQPNGIECRLNEDGSENKNYVDLLDEDKPVANQKFVCVSFLSPENLLKQRNMYNFKKFLNQWEMSKSLSKYTQFLSFVAYKYNLQFDDLNKDLEEFCKEERDNLFQTTLEDEFKTFIDKNENDLEESFKNEHTFQTSVRGLKVRGSYPTQQEAELRCKMLREVDPNHDVFVGPVGMWMPFHPEAYKTGRVEYIEEELNALMNEKQVNEDRAKVEFDKRLLETKKNALEENKKNAEESGNVLTQTLNEEGQLVSVKNINTMDNGLGDDITVSDIKKELFEDENVVINHKNNEDKNNLNKISEEQTTEEQTTDESDKITNSTELVK